MGKPKIKVITSVHVKPLSKEEDEVREAQLVGLDKEVFLMQEVFFS